jgi:superfamily I DNA/RNA helicase
MKWSNKQQAVFADVASGEGHTMVDAVAGSGKTTTILEAMKSVPAGKSVLFVAFNKSIATELAKRAPEGVDVSKRRGQSQPSIEEANLLYVAITRARKELFLVQQSS